MPDGELIQNIHAVGPERRGKLALYREWRPRTFGEVVEQEHVVKTLKNSILNNRLAHAYLFCGTHGTGKTTLAQILSRAVNCLNPDGAEPCNACESCEGILSGRILDVAEIDAASNNSVDNVRTLRDQINYAPAQTKYKVYIIDEVHMLSGSAYNALLKTLEEPPSYVIFILATTEPHTLPATILSRCQRFDFRRITDGAIAGRLAYIAENTGVKADQAALRLIASLSEGALRDAISIFDQCASAKPGESLTLEDVLKITGRPEDENLVRCADIIINGDVKSIPGHVAEIESAGVSLPQYIDGMAAVFRNMLMIKLGQGSGAFPEINAENFDKLRRLADVSDVDYLIAVASEFSLMVNTIKGSINQTVLFEVSLAKLCLGRFRTDGAIEKINARIGGLEKWIRQLSAQLDNRQVITSDTQPVTIDGGADDDNAAIDESDAENEDVESADAESTAPSPVDKGVWGNVVSRFLTNGNPALYSILQGTSAQTLGDNFQIVLPVDKASLSGLILNHANINKVNEEISTVTNRKYNIQVISDTEPFNGLPKKLSEKFNIPTKIHP